MEIYLLRHAIAQTPITGQSSDRDRPLTEEGIEKMQRAAKGMKRIIDGFDSIISSTYLRAQETARIVAEEFGSVGKLEKSKSLDVDTTIEAMMDFLQEQSYNERVLLVGHEPSISYLASFLIGSDEQAIEFRKGTICRIDTEHIAKGKGILIWHLQPKQLRMLVKQKDKGN